MNSIELERLVRSYADNRLTEKDIKDIVRAVSSEMSVLTYHAVRKEVAAFVARKCTSQ